MEQVEVEVERDLGIPPVNSSSSDALAATIDAMGRARTAPSKMPMPAARTRSPLFARSRNICRLAWRGE
jgi:hypothetical protein